MPYPDLFIWWAMSISWSSVFLTAVSIYLYENSRTRREEGSRAVRDTFRLGKDFMFIWVLIGLLVLYIVSINRGSSTLFAAGNIVVEAILIAYMLKNRSGKSEQTQRPTKDTRP